MDHEIKDFRTPHDLSTELELVEVEQSEIQGQI